MMPKEVQVRVADAKQRDVGHGKVRVDNATMEKLGITAGDFIEVRGKRTTVAIPGPLMPKTRLRKSHGSTGFSGGTQE